MEKAAFLAFQVKCGLAVPKLVNALSPSSGTGSLALRLTLAWEVKFGMFTPTAANALIPLTGTEKSAKVYPSAPEVKLLIATMNVPALLGTSGAETSASILLALEDKFGQAQNVSVLLA